MIPRITPTLLVILLACNVQAAVEHQVFHANGSSTRFGYDVQSTSIQAYTGNPCETTPGDCVKADTDEDRRGFLGKALTGDKLAYRVGLRIYASSEGATSGIHVAFSFDARQPSAAIQGDGSTKGVFADSIQLRLKETDDGWDLRLGQTKSGTYAELAHHTDLRSPNAWREYAFQVNTTSGVASVLDDSGATILSATMTHHRGVALQSQWFMFKGYQSVFSNYAYLKLTGQSTAIHDQDPRPPTISGLQQNPARLASGQSVQITATIRDDWSSPSGVVKTWRNDVAAANYTMTFTGDQAHATLPGQDNGVRVRYQVAATDDEGLTSQSDLIEYKVGSNQDPTNLGGGSATFIPEPLHEQSRLDVALGVLFILGLGFLAFFVSRQHYPRLAPKFVWSAIALSLAYVVYAVNEGDFSRAVQESPHVVWIGVAVLALGLAVAVRIRQVRTT